MKEVDQSHINSAPGVGAEDASGSKKRVGAIVSDAATETMQLRKVIEEKLVPVLEALLEQGKTLTEANVRKADDLIGYLKSDQYWQRMGEEIGTRERKG